MKKQMFITTAVCAAIVAALVLSVPALAGNIFKFSGLSADAYFSTPDSTGCIFTDVFVFASQGKQQSPPGPPGAQSGANIYISQYDICNNYVQLLGASGFTPLGSGDFQVSKDLGAATLNVTINVYDYVSDTSFDVAVNLDWVGIGDLQKGKSSSQYQSGKCKFHSRWMGSWRFAESTGTISNGVTNFTPDPSVYANLQSVKSGDVTIGCN